jgi:hypothetical protein
MLQELLDDDSDRLTTEDRRRLGVIDWLRRHRFEWVPEPSVGKWLDAMWEKLFG